MSYLITSDIFLLRNDTIALQVIQLCSYLDSGEDDQCDDDGQNQDLEPVRENEQPGKLERRPHPRPEALFPWWTPILQLIV